LSRVVPGPPSLIQHPTTARRPLAPALLRAFGARPSMTHLSPTPRRLAPAAGGEPAVPGWTAATPDEMVDQLFARARRGGPDALAALVVAASLDDRASYPHVRSGLASFAASGSPLADEAYWLALRLTPN